MTSDIRAVYLATATHVVQVIDRPTIGERWDQPSALDRMSIGDLTAHLCRSIQLVAAFLDAAEPDAGDPVTPQAYIGDLIGLDDLDSAVNAGIRDRARQDGSVGYAATVDAARRTLQALGARLPGVPAERRVTVFAGRSMLVDDFLRTRLVEFAVHLDDLAASLGDDISAPPEALTEALAVLLGIARHRHGDLAVVRALARPERDVVDALRVF